MTTLTWQWCSFDELSVPQLYAILGTRAAVFIVEQNCVYPDIDGFDREAMHLTAWDGDDVAAYLRVLAPGKKYREPSIGRVLTAASHRGRGLGRELLAHGIRYTETLFPGEAIHIGAQAYLEAFYGSFGFVRCSDIYIEDGIPHIEMMRPA